MEDEKNKISKEQLVEKEYNYIKQKDSWGGFHTIEIACLVFNISIEIYTNNRSKDEELVLLHYVNNNHFNLLYDENIEFNK